MSLTVNNGHPDYDDGVTPHSGPAIAGFARASAAMVRRFPAIRAVEVGNEVNAANFVTGPLAKGSLEARAMGYLALLKATYAAVKAENPAVRVLGGGLHSVPVGYLGPLMGAGAGSYMDALAIHPYTTPPEQLVRQIAVLRAVPGLAEMPLEVTEFGSENGDAAPHHLLKSYCAFALAGVSRAAWYPLHPRGDGLAALYSRRGQITEVGQAYLYLQSLLPGLPARDVSPDPFTYACAFGDRALVIWGDSREVRLAEGMQATDATGAKVEPRLSLDRPLVITGAQAPFLGTTVTLAAPDRPILADSFDQYSYGAPLGFEVFARRDGRDVVLILKPGQERAATFWTPYLGLADDAGVRLTADQLLPSGGGDRATRLVHRYVHAGQSQNTVLVYSLAPPDRSDDGVELRVTLNGKEAVFDTVTTPVRGQTPFDLTPGDVLEIEVGPGANAKGDLVGYRFTLRQLP